MKTCKNCRAFEWCGPGGRPFCSLGHKPEITWHRTVLGAAPIGKPTEPCGKPTTTKKLVELHLARQQK